MLLLVAALVVAVLVVVAALAAWIAGERRGPRTSARGVELAAPGYGIRALRPNHSQLGLDEGRVEWVRNALGGWTLGRTLSG